MKLNVFLALLPSHDNRRVLAERILACEAKRSPLIRVNWTHLQDLHLTLGYIGPVEEKDIRSIAMGLSMISQLSAPIMATVEEVRVYGNAIVLRVQPQQPMLTLHKKLNQKLMEVTNNQYQFQTKNRFDPHVSVGRVRNVPDLNQLHKNQFMSLVTEQFRGYSFLIQQAGLMYRGPEHATPAYQTVQLYTLRG